MAIQRALRKTAGSDRQQRAIGVGAISVLQFAQWARALKTSVENFGKNE